MIPCEDIFLSNLLYMGFLNEASIFQQRSCATTYNDANSKACIANKKVALCFQVSNRDAAYVLHNNNM